MEYIQNTKITDTPMPNCHSNPGPSPPISNTQNAQSTFIPATKLEVGDHAEHSGIRFSKKRKFIVKRIPTIFSFVTIVVLSFAVIGLYLLIRSERNAICLTPSCIHTGRSNFDNSKTAFLNFSSSNPQLN